MTELDNKILASMKQLGERIPCSIEVLTPVHIGSGIRLTKGMDFFSGDNTTTIIPQSVFLEHLQNNPDDLEKFNNPNFNPASILRNISDGKKYYIECSSRDIYQFERNGNGNPYIPGSSLKGAIRTILLKHFLSLLQDDERELLIVKIKGGKEQKASDPILQTIFGKDERDNLLRVVLPGDADFVENSIDLNRVYILNVQNDTATQYGWKNSNRPEKGGGTFNDFTKGTPIFVETLNIGTHSNFTIKMDDFLLDNPKAQEKLHFNEKRFTLSQLAQTINRFSREALLSEIGFFNRFNSKELKDLITGMEKLLNTIPPKDSDREAKEFLFRLSWGTGWKTMTGDFLTEQQLQRIRQLYRLGKTNIPIFPKTRKIVFDDRTPKYPCGWIKVRLNNTIVEPRKPENKVVHTVNSGWDKLESKGFRVVKKKN